MNKFKWFAVLLSIAAVLLPVSGCDRSIDFNNGFDDSITIGDYFGKKLKSQKFVLEDLIAIEDIIDINGLDPDATWDIIEELEIPLTIPDMTFGPFNIDNPGITESDIDMLIGSGSIHIVLNAVSSLPVDVDINIDFIYPDGTVRLNDEPVRISGTVDGTDPWQIEDIRFEITEEQLRGLAMATGIGGEINNENLEVRLNRNDFAEFSFTVEKTGGINL